MYQYPEEPPKINWALYKKTIPIPGLVDDFEKQYNAFKVPYPPDTVSSQLDGQEKEVQDDIAKFKSESNTRIEE